MIHHEDLAEADRLIADCMDRIARQREVITTRYEQELPTDVAESMLRAFEESLRALEKHRHTSLIGSETRSDGQNSGGSDEHVAKSWRRE
jgi:hypothetical protein